MFPLFCSKNCLYWRKATSKILYCRKIKNGIWLLAKMCHSQHRATANTVPQPVWLIRHLPFFSISLHVIKCWLNFYYRKNCLFWGCQCLVSAPGFVSRCFGKLPNPAQDAHSWSLSNMGFPIYCSAINEVVFNTITPPGFSMYSLYTGYIWCSCMSEFHARIHLRGYIPLFL